MSKRILLIQGHPDSTTEHLCHGLSAAYQRGALAAGHEVRVVDVAKLDFPLLRSQQEWETGEVPPALHEAQKNIQWAQHLVLFFPLWLGDMPALLKGFLEQVARPGFAFSDKDKKSPARQGLNGRSARVVVTMGMPALVYRWYFGAHSVKSLKRNILAFVGIKPVTTTLVGMVGAMKKADVDTWFEKLERLGKNAN